MLCLQTLSATKSVFLGEILNTNTHMKLYAFVKFHLFLC